MSKTFRTVTLQLTLVHTLQFMSHCSAFSCSLSPFFLIVIRKESTESERDLDKVRQVVSPSHTDRLLGQPRQGIPGKSACSHLNSHFQRISSSRGPALSFANVIMYFACLLSRTSLGGMCSDKPHFTDKGIQAWKALIPCSRPRC